MKRIDYAKPRGVAVEQSDRAIKERERYRRKRAKINENGNREGLNRRLNELISQGMQAEKIKQIIIEEYPKEAKMLMGRKVREGQDVLDAQIADKISRRVTGSERKKERNNDEGR